MPAPITPVYRRSLFEARTIGEAFRRATRNVDGALFRARMEELAASGLPEGRGQARHSPGFIAVLTEVATATKEAERGDARAFAQQFVSRPSGYSQSRAGLAAVQFEAWLIESGGGLYSQFVETVLDGGETNFLAIFEGRLSEQDKTELLSGTTPFVKVAVIAEAGAVSYEQGEILEFSMFDCKVVGKPRDILPRDVADPNALYAPLGSASAAESIAPKTHEQYARVVSDGGIERATCAYLFEAAMADAVADGGRLVLRDPNGVAWMSETGDVWTPILSSFRDASHLYETAPDGSRRSFCRSWALFSSPILLEGVETPATVVVAGGHAWAVTRPMAEIVRVVNEVAGLYVDLPAEGDMMLEAVLRDMGQESGTPCTDEGRIVESVQPTDERPTIADRNQEVRRASARRLTEGVAGEDTDVGRMRQVFEAAFEARDLGPFAQCHFDSKLSEGQLFVTFANEDADGFLLSIGPFTRDGRAIGDVRVETLTASPRDAALVGKTATLESITNYVEKFISSLTEVEDKPEKKPAPKEGKPNPP